jgi:mercuric ion transport protein
MRFSSMAFATAACVFLGGVVLQVFLAGLGAFKLSDWTAHAGFGWLLASAPLFVLLPLVFVARADTRTRWLTLLLTVAAAFQPELAGARATNPVLAAVHPVNALLIFWLALQIARSAIRGARRPGSSTAQPVARDAREVSSDVAA